MDNQLITSIRNNDINLFIKLIKHGTTINKDIFKFVSTKSEFYDYIIIVNRVDITIELNDKFGSNKTM